MTYDEAPTTLHATLAGMQSRYGSRLGAFFLYQAHDQYASGHADGPRGVLRRHAEQRRGEGRLHRRGQERARGERLIEPVAAVRAQAVPRRRLDLRRAASLKRDSV